MRNLMFALLILLSGQTVLAQTEFKQATVKQVDKLSSPYRETNLCLSKDGNAMYFMSLRGGQPWSKLLHHFNGQAVFDGDIWASKKVGNDWQTPICLPPNINTAHGEDEPWLSSEANVLYFQSWNSVWKLNDGPYYTSLVNANNYSEPRGLGGGITRFFKDTGLENTDGMSVNESEDWLVFACGEGYDTPMDLYESHKDSLGNWSYCRKLPFNTNGDERSVFISTDGKTIYFASDGLPGGYGGLDIYRISILPSGLWGTAVNLGPAINTNADEYGMVLMSNGMGGYFVRNGDIYEYALPGSNPAPPSEDTFSLKDFAYQNLILLLDVSASMQPPERLPLLIEGFEKLLKHTRQEDKISIVTYSGETKVMLEAIAGVQRDTIIKILRSLHSGGVTRCKPALEKSFALGGKHYIENGNNRIILATDGGFRVEDLFELVESQHHSGRNISLSTFYFGQASDPVSERLRQLTSIGRGNFVIVQRENINLAVQSEVRSVARK